MKSICLAASVAVCLVVSACEPRDVSSAKGDGWLQSAASDAERFALIERQFRGFDNAMWEVGERYRSLHEALMRENYDLAVYHWDKIKTALDNGTERRPGRKASAETLFLPHWQDVRDGLGAAVPESAWRAFEDATSACKSCHDAEKVSYMNNQSVFELMRPSATSP